MIAVQFLPDLVQGLQTLRLSVIDPNCAWIYVAVGRDCEFIFVTRAGSEADAPITELLLDVFVIGFELLVLEINPHLIVFIGGSKNLVGNLREVCPAEIHSTERVALHLLRFTGLNIDENQFRQIHIPLV